MNKEKNIEIKADDRKQERILVSFKPTVDIPTGRHDGKIVSVDVYRGEFEYIHVGIKPTDVETHLKLDVPTLKIGYPLSLSFKSGLGKLLIKSGFDISVKTDYTLTDMQKMLLNREVTFLCYNNSDDRGTFTEIDKDSITFI